MLQGPNIVKCNERSVLVLATMSCLWVLDSQRADRDEGVEVGLRIRSGWEKQPRNYSMCFARTMSWRRREGGKRPRTHNNSWFKVGSSTEAIFHSDQKTMRQRLIPQTVVYWLG